MSSAPQLRFMPSMRGTAVPTVRRPWLQLMTAGAGRGVASSSNASSNAAEPAVRCNSCTTQLHAACVAWPGGPAALTACPQTAYGGAAPLLARAPHSHSPTPQSFTVTSIPNTASGLD